MKKNDKRRLDVLLVEKGLFPSREKAKASVMAGVISVNGKTADKPGTEVAADSIITVKENPNPYVSRGGLKLEKLMRQKNIDLRGMTCMDIGASTGGFTDCMLAHGAEKIYAVDVGYGQLDWKLRGDPRVINMERVNIRCLDPDTIAERMDFISIDVSFISLKLVFPVAAALLKEEGMIAALIKPQFEAGREQVGRGGIVRDEKVRRRVLERVLGYGRDNGLYADYLTVSPIKGAKGNREYLASFLKKESELHTDIKGEQLQHGII